MEQFTSVGSQIAAIDYGEITPMCKSGYDRFQPATSCSAESWKGVWWDLFTPSATCSEPMRDINVTASGSISVGHQYCNGTNNW